MDRVIISPRSEDDIKLLLEIAKKMGFPAKILSEEEMEDWGLMEAMKESQDDKYVSKDRIMNILNSDGN